MITARRLAAGAALLAAFGAPAFAQHTHVLIVTGLGGEPQYSTEFRQVGNSVYRTAKSKWGVADSSVIYLAEDPADDPHISSKSTKEEIQAAILRLAHRAAPGDVVFVFLLGHGSGEGPDSRVNVPGPDPTAADYAAWMSGFAKQTVVFVNASSASGDFIQVMQGQGRIVVTATKSAFERNESLFATFFANGIESGEADANKDGRVSVFEAFDYARSETARSYDTAKKLQTEHSVVSDSTLAHIVAFGGAPVSNDPKVAALVAERRALEDQLAALRARKAQMDSTAYQTELERLLIAIAEKTEAIRKAGGGQ